MAAVWCVMLVRTPPAAGLRYMARQHMCMYTYTHCQRHYCHQCPHNQQLTTTCSVPATHAHVRCMARTSLQPVPARCPPPVSLLRPSDESLQHTTTLHDKTTRSTRSKKHRQRLAERHGQGEQAVGTYVHCVLHTFTNHEPRTRRAGRHHHAPSPKPFNG